MRNTTTNAFSHFRTKLTNVVLDLRFGALLRGGKETSYPHLGAYATNNSSYGVIHTLFRGRVKPSDVLVDVGCGKGRVINAWLAEGYANRMIGIELDPDVAAESRRRLRRFPNVSILTGEILANFPRDGTLFYLFNPFNAAMMSKFKETLKECLSSRSVPKATLVYYNSLHADVFAGDEACEIEYGVLKHPYAVIHLVAPGTRGAGV
ncbi:MAG: methyltransferase domain-containing protein [Candidatus Acidiferrum sp.]